MNMRLVFRSFRFSTRAHGGIWGVSNLAVVAKVIKHKAVRCQSVRLGKDKATAWFTAVPHIATHITKMIE